MFEKNQSVSCSNAVQKIKDIMKKALLDDRHNVESDSDKSESDKVSVDFWSDHHKLVHKNWKSNKIILITVTK